MRIIIKENLDDFKDDYLDYNEDKYYLVNTFKDFKKYGHKDKHHQDIQAITSNFKDLLDDLENNNIYINDQFKKTKDNDLDKENNYFILPYKLTNNIIEQLGYKANPLRTYKDDIINYQGKNISSDEFENIISDEKSEFNWLTNCIFKNAKIDISEGSQMMRMTGVTWISGDILDGESYLFESTWISGTFKGLALSNSTFKGGIFKGGFFSNSSFENGIWEINTSTKWLINSKWLSTHKIQEDIQVYFYDKTGNIINKSRKTIFNDKKLLESVLEYMNIYELEEVYFGDIRCNDIEINNMINRSK